ncbi:hypothetical protein [Lacinutrix himadriensis]|uniref:hypothetical protein n=1 Tax=Lacinutrix himadriensis TaxID=641549 RepID=UPI0006E15237|nr:hypothetical protein [Lacinutrix himadriensis]
MKKWYYIFVLILFFACKKKTKSEDVFVVKKDSTTVVVKKDIPQQQKTDGAISIQDSIYKWFTPKEMGDLQIRTVSAINGVNVRDSLGNKTGKLDFGESVYILDYNKDSITIKDNNQMVTGRKAKVVTTWSNVKTKVNENQYAYKWFVKKEDIGFVFEGFLYENNQNVDENSLYSYNYLSTGAKGNESKIDLRELLDIRKVNSTDFNILEKEANYLSAPKKIDGRIALHFENAKKLVLKDTTYLNSEYTPTRTYDVFIHEDFPTSYMVSESMFFMPDIHTELSMKTGDTLNVFQGYPYISPNKNYAVLITYDQTECYHDTYFQICKKDKQNKYISMFGYTPQSWSYPFIKNNAGSMDAVFSMSWLNNNTFIIKAVDYVGDCYEPDQLSKPYYLKFEIKL